MSAVIETDWLDSSVWTQGPLTTDAAMITTPLYSFFFPYRPDADVVTSAPEPHDAARFPHRCPGCGAHAYVGLNQVEHERKTECRR